MAQSAVSTVLGSVGNLAVQETKFLCGVTLEVAFLKDELMRLLGYLKDADSKWRSGNARVAVLVNQIRAAAYDAQNVIEAADYMEKRNSLKKGFMGAISRYACLPTDLATLRDIGIEIQRVRRKLKEIFEGADRLKIDLDSTAVVDNEFPQDFHQLHQSFENDIVMVGFEDEHEEIVDKLVHHENMLSAVSIVAMGGAGKTTLAKKVYTSSRVRQHFDTVAWVTVSQTFKGTDLLQDIIQQITGGTYDSTDQLQKFRDFLVQKRYLIVLDDVWEVDTWDQLNRTFKAFPDASNGSRVLLTTRKLDVANHLEMPTHVHALKHLNEEKSWELFCSKALPSYRRSVMCDVDEFEKLGRKIARKCDGLPLALTVLGGYLSRNLNIQSWSDVLLGWPSTKNVDMMRSILARSYKDLPNHLLRSCFLYLAALPEDFEIKVSFLVELWIAEGFIPHEPKHDQEQTARMYVAELAQRSLVQVTRRSMAHGWIEEIRVHDILRDWCIEEARQDGFLEVIDKTSGQVVGRSIDIMTSYRSSYQDINDPNLQAMPDLRALIGFQLKPISLRKLKFLRVLHIEDSKLENLSSAIGGCIHLRYLGLINCKDVSLPASIGQLIYLQTIDMTGTYSPVPKSMWDIPSLRHVYLSNGFSPPRRLQQKELKTFQLQLGSASKCFKLDMVTFLGQMTQLTTLSLRSNLYQHMLTELMSIFENMPLLVDVYLDRLSLVDTLPHSHHFSQSLRSFDLSAVKIKQDPMPVLEKLPCLVVLKLVGYLGETMSCSSRGFPRLQKLHLVNFLYTKEWKVETGAMPKLSHLILEWFSSLSNLPDGLLHLPALNRVEVDNSYVGDERALNELQQKGCKVIKRCV